MRSSWTRLTGLLCATLSGCGSSQPPAPYQASASCSLKSPQEWQAFLESSAAESSWTTTCSDLNDCGERLGDFSAHVEQDIAEPLRRCEQDVAEHPQIAACSGRLRSFLPVWQRQHALETYGFEQDNAAYFARQTRADAPDGLMDFPQALLSALPNRAQLELTAREQGFPYLVHDSGLGGTRLFVRIPDPGGHFERFIVVGLDEQLEHVVEGTIASFVGLQLATAEGEALQQPLPLFRDYVLHTSEQGWQAALPVGSECKCYGCHVSGLRQLIPTRARVAEALPVLGEADYGRDVDAGEYGLEQLARFNAHIASFGLADWADTLHVADHGPALGRELGCTDCHDGVQRGPLTVLASEGTLWTKVVGELSMGRHDASHAIPDAAAMQLQARSTAGVPLAANEADLLASAQQSHQADFDRLMSSRSSELARWLLETSCE